jgi:hypothetical protein
MWAVFAPRPDGSLSAPQRSLFSNCLLKNWTPAKNDAGMAERL